MGISVRIKLGRCDCGWACGGKCIRGALGLMMCSERWVVRGGYHGMNVKRWCMEGVWSRGAPKTKIKH